MKRTTWAARFPCVGALAGRGPVDVVPLNRPPPPRFLLTAEAVLIAAIVLSVLVAWQMQRPLIRDRGGHCDVSNYPAGGLQVRIMFPNIPSYGSVKA